MSETKSHQLLFHGKAGEYFSIWIVNLLLTIVTLGIYSAWAKVRNNKYFYNHLELHGERFDYHARPMQILKGRIVAVGCFIVFGAAQSFAPELALVLMLAFFLVLPALLRNNVRFDCAMTSYHNIRFGFEGTMGGIYLAIVGRGLLVAIAAFGIVGIFSALDLPILMGIGLLFVLLIGPYWVMAKMNEYFLNGYRYGESQFSAVLSTKTYIKIHVIAGFIATAVVSISMLVGFLLVLASGGDVTAIGEMSDLSVFGGMFIIMILQYILLFALGLIVFSYTSARLRAYNFSQTILTTNDAESTPLEFESRIGARGLIWLHVSNFLAQVFSLGLARPWIMIRTTRYFSENTIVRGDIEQFKVKQAQLNESGSIADGMADVFDIGAGIV